MIVTLDGERWDPRAARWVKVPSSEQRNADATIAALVSQVKDLQSAVSVRSSAAVNFAFPWGGSEGEWTPGGWQRNLADTPRETPFRFSAVYACVSLIAGDISKLRLMLTEQQPNLTWKEVTDSPLLAVIRRPNGFQTWRQFVDDWITSKLSHGNTYVLLERDNRGGFERGIVSAMYVLHPQCVTPLIAENGDIFYRIGPDRLADIDEQGTVVPAEDIVHDRMTCIWHPLIGVSPLFACVLSALQGIAIQNNAQRFFANMAMPSGILTAPKAISDPTAARLKAAWAEKFSGNNVGRVAVLGDGLTFERMTMTAVDSQLAEQFGLMAADVARAFHVPPYKIGLQQNVLASTIGQLDQDYYSQCLQTLLEAFEQLIDKAFALPLGRRTEFDTDGLLRMDPSALADANAKALGSGELAPNEARAKRNLPPVKGGAVPLMQQQMWPIDVLAERAPPASPSAPAPAPDATPADTTPPPARDAGAQTRALIERLQTREFFR